MNTKLLIYSMKLLEYSMLMISAVFEHTQIYVGESPNGFEEYWLRWDGPQVPGLRSQMGYGPQEAKFEHNACMRLKHSLIVKDV